MNKKELKELWGIESGYPAFPQFAPDNEGIFFSLIETPFKFGMNFCLNRPTRLKLIKSPLFEKPKEGATPQNYLESLH